MIAQFNDHCRECGDGIAKGDEVHYALGVITCLDCGPATPEHHRGAATGLEDAPGYVRALETRVAELEREVARLTTRATDISGALWRWAEALSEELNVAPPEPNG